MKEQIIQIVAILERARQRPAMYLGWQSIPAAVNFLNGIQAACRALGVEMLPEARIHIGRRRGWECRAGAGVHAEMRERGLSEAAVIEELFAIEIDAWKLTALEQRSK